MDIKSYIIKNLKDCTKEDIKETILASINSNDEVVLPGLGVLFEMVWDSNNLDVQQNIVNILFDETKKA